MSEKMGYRYTAYAADDHTGKEGYAVVIDGGKNGIPSVAIAGAGVAIDGVIYKAEEKDAVETIVKEGIVNMVVGADIAAKGEVQIDATGCIITKAAGTAVGKVFAACSKGDIVPVFLY